MSQVWIRTSDLKIMTPGLYPICHQNPKNYFYSSIGGAVVELHRHNLKVTGSKPILWKYSPLTILSNIHKSPQIIDPARPFRKFRDHESKISKTSRLYMLPCLLWWSIFLGSATLPKYPKINILLLGSLKNYRNIKIFGIKW